MNTARKIKTLPELLRQIAAWKLLGERIIFTNGCFDLLHEGHLHLLASCKNMGGKVIVGLNSDASVKRLKGEKRPIRNEASRAAIVAALMLCDAVVLFEEDTPKILIEAILPDVLVKGGDYQLNEIVGSDFVQANGGRVEIISLLDGHSTTQTIERF